MKRLANRGGAGPMRAESGQSLAFVALTLAFLTPFVFAIIEFSERQLEVAQMEDALQQATRSAVQTFAYDALANNRRRINEERAKREARLTFERNLGTVQGLSGTPADVARQVTWTILPEGGTCRFDNQETMTFDRPAVCAEVRPTLTGFGLLGYGPYRPLITAAAALDVLER